MAEPPPPPQRTPSVSDGSLPSSAGVGGGSSGHSVGEMEHRLKYLDVLQGVLRKDPLFLIPHVERLLVKEDFQRVFEVSVEEFTKLPGWHQTQLLKKTRLYVGHK